MRKNWGVRCTVQVFVILCVVLSCSIVALAADDWHFQVTVQKEPQHPIDGIKVYLFEGNGGYLGLYQVTDALGGVEFSLSEGSYKVRADYLGYQFWSDDIPLRSNTDVELTIPHQDVTVTVQGNYPAAEPLDGEPVYLFTQAGTYMNQKQSTDAAGQVVFRLPDQPYKVRADYLEHQYWSADFRWEDAAVIVPQGEAHVEVTAGGVPLPGTKVYAFSAADTYLGLVQATDAGGTVSFRLPAGAYKFRADCFSSQYWSAEEVLSASQVNPVLLSTGGGEFSFTVSKGAGAALPGAKCYVFSETGTYLKLHGTTDNEGLVRFNLADGVYKFRVDYLGYQFWSPVYTVPATLAAELIIPHQDVTFTVQCDYPATEQLAAVPVYLFTQAGAYMNQKQSTDAAGQVVFSLPDQPYKVRADYLEHQYWSADFRWQDAAVTVPQGEAQVQVTAGGLPLPGTKVYAFSAAGTYLGLVQPTDAGGTASFRLPAGAYKFRADCFGGRYWSADQVISAGQVNPVVLSTGGGEFSFTVSKGVDDHLAGVKCYVFSETDTYLNLHDTTGSEGLVRFNLSDGSYKFRVDYRGNQFWSPVYTVPATLAATLTIPHQDVTVTVQGNLQTAEPLAGVRVYLFTQAGAYMNQKQSTDAAGQVVFSLPDQPYKVRADYLEHQYWSADFRWQNAAVIVPQGEAHVEVTAGGVPLPGTKVYAFSAADTYLGLVQATDAGGTASFRLPASVYKFRADCFGGRYWSAEQMISAGQVNPVLLSTGGGEFSFTVSKGIGDQLTGVKCYVFNETGTYLNLHGATDSEGLVRFNLADGAYKFRVDYLGYRFWSPVHKVPATLAATLTIPHQDVTVTVQGNLQTAEPLAAVRVYLFTQAGAYMNQKQSTDAAGQVIFSLPDQPYKVRADYISQQYWSADFRWQNAAVTVPQGLARISVTRLGVAVPAAKVYPFSGTGTYLGWNEATDAAGAAEFVLPDRSYKFRVNEGGDQKWSPVIGITAGVVNDVEIDLAPVTVNLTADPEFISAGSSLTLSWSSEGADTCVIEPNIGTVGLNGSISVSPAATTTYTITATGTEGTAADSAQVNVVAFEDVDYGFIYNEQQGGGGLVGDTVRILNGNAIDTRSVLSFPSPNSLGLSFEAAYNSKSDIQGILGFGWTHTYSPALDTSVGAFGGSVIRIVDETGRSRYFRQAAADVFEGLYHEPSRVNFDAGKYVWHRLNGSRYGFSIAGMLLWIDDEKGNRLLLNYDDQGLLETVTDTASGRLLSFHYTDGLLTHITGPTTAAVSDGIWVTYGYDGYQNLTSVEYADRSGFNYSYNDADDPHNLTEKRNKANHLINTWAYDGQDRCTDNYSGSGRGATIDYVNAGQVDVTDAYGTLRTYTLSEISGHKRVTALQGPVGAPYEDNNIVRWQYDADLNLIEIETAGGALHQYQNHDPRGNPQTIVLASGTPEQRTIVYTYHPAMDLPLMRTEPSALGTGNKVSIWDWDNDYDLTPNENPASLLSRLIEKGNTKDAAGATVPFEYVTTFTYNAAGQVVNIDGPRTAVGDETSINYYANGDLDDITRPLIGTAYFNNYDDAGQPGRVTYVNDQAEAFAYDGRGRISAITHEADASANSVMYNSAGLPEIAIDEDGVEKFYEYDSQYGRLFQIYDIDDNYIEHQYDSQGNLIERSKHAPSGARLSRKRWSFTSPDIPGKLWKNINFDGTFTEYRYDGAGNVSSMTDAENNISKYNYDLFNRLTDVIQSMNQTDDTVTTYGYDSHGNLNSVTDAANHQTTYEYDDLGRVVTVNSTDTGTTRYSYDEAGNLSDKADANDITIHYAYDTLNRLEEVQFADAAQNIRYSYDQGQIGIGKLTGVTDLSGGTSFSYNHRGRVVSKTSTVNEVAYSLTREFTLGGRLKSIIYPSGRNIDYGRYPSGKVKDITAIFDAQTTPLIANLAYRPFGGPSGLNTGFGGTVNNQSSECDCLEVANPGSTMEQIYTYDGKRSLLSIRGTHTPWFDQDFVYDSLGRLKQAIGIYGNIQYTYDQVGNRLARTTYNRAETYSLVPGTNRLLEITGSSTETCSHDENGNITGLGNKIFVYDQNNRLVIVQENEAILAEYMYNAFGQRVAKTVDGETTIFHYDFDGNIISEGRLDGQVETDYIYLFGNRIAMADTESGNTYHYLNNRLGTPLLLTDDTGSVVWEAYYKPFGSAFVISHSAIENNFRFAGQYYDEETGLHYNWHRYYDPKTGRYLTPDPIGLAGGINLFSYAENNPINLVDPLGLRAGSAVRPGTRGLDPSAHPVFHPGSYENQLIANDLMKLIRLMDPRPLAKDISGLFHNDSSLYPPGPISPEDIERQTEEMEKQLADSNCEERTPWMGPGNGYDPEDPDNDPKAPLWKKIARVIMDLIRAGNP